MHKRTAALFVLLSASGTPVLGQTPQDSLFLTVHGADLLEWHVGEAVTRLGLNSQSRPHEQFFNIASVLLLGDSAVLVVDGSSREVRVFHVDGHVLRAFGGSGGGPGEFASQPWVAWTAGDTLVVLDASRREHVFNVAGTHLRTVRPLVSPVGTRMRRIGQFADGARLARYATPPPPGQGDEYTVPFTLVRVDSDERRELLALPGYVVVPQARAQPLGVVYAPRLQVAVAGHQFCVGFPSEWAIDCYSSSGLLLRRLRAPDAAPMRVTQDDIRAFFEGLEQANPGPSSYVERLRRTSKFATHLPVHGRMLFSTSGDLWVGPYLINEETLGTFNPSPPGPTKWIVIRFDGSPPAGVTLPTGFRLMDASDRLVVGTFRDSHDVEQVLVLPLDIGPR